MADPVLGRRADSTDRLPSSTGIAADRRVSAKDREPALRSSQEEVVGPGVDGAAGPVAADPDFLPDAGRSGMTPWMSACAKCAFLYRRFRLVSSACATDARARRTRWSRLTRSFGAESASTAARSCFADARISAACAFT